ncbi:FtsW/RodA/SpoVE family cell cycle protein [Longimicrobium terrae]|uniref:Probable peptidoglycan glycosyltransferase FtsW n=1 Tax=Longimicrobium terrae TaxID=1639882 RepID=A0A841H4I0_9BACT|nr:putative peptidoglycan glycosyltransferase FtsW [Longimicrobium terrae]MBB4638556.1 cell division protein FtsW [Longimicrobium terrae]MBB6072806.1 cell division protein FtsW [Longimicrobium terrae]NNC30577.1 cell division protein FtsW [Longimicrobium terrae]
MTSIALLRRPRAAKDPVQPPVTPRERAYTTAPAVAALPREQTWEARALVALTAMAFAFGLTEMYSASSFEAASHDLPGHYFALKQVMGAGIGVVLAAVLSRVDYRQLRRFAWPMLAMVIVLLALVVMPGTEALAPRVNGARRWLKLGIQFQPSEFAKIALIVWTAMMAVKKADRLHSLSKGLMPFLLVWLPILVLVMKQPNMSAALLLVLLAALVLFAGGARIGHFILLGLLAVPVLWKLITGEGYRARRLAAFLDPAHDTGNVSYQIHQSLIAIGSGGLGGVGFGESRQKYGFLPESHNDFLFSMIAEEWGLLGVLFVVAVFAGFLVVGYRIAARAPDRFGYLVALGMTNLIAVSAFLHMGVAMALLPTTGVALPFMSSGLSALLTSFAAVGILLSIARAAKDPERAR